MLIEVPTYIELVKKVRQEKPHLGLKGAKDLCDSFFGSSTAYHATPVGQIEGRLEAFKIHIKGYQSKVTFTDHQLYTLCARYLTNLKDSENNGTHILTDRACEFVNQYMDRL